MTQKLLAFSARRKKRAFLLSKKMNLPAKKIEKTVDKHEK